MDIHGGLHGQSQMCTHLVRGSDSRLCISEGNERFCAPDPDGDGSVTGGRESIAQTTPLNALGFVVSSTQTDPNLVSD